MRPRTLLVLFALVAGLLAFVLVYERDLPSSEERAELARRVLRLEADEVEALVVEIGEHTVRLERVAAAGEAAAAGEGEGEGGLEDGPEDGTGESEWRLVAPLAARADGAAVDRLLAALLALEKKRTLDEPAPAGLGLDPPRARVRLVTRGGEQELLVGSEVPASSSMVVALGGPGAGGAAAGSAGAEAYVVAAAVWTDLSKEPGEWRSRDLFPGDEADVERLTLAAGDRRLLLARRGGGFWIEAPLADRADREKVEGLLDEVTGLRAAGFVDEPPPATELGLEPAAGTVEVVLRGRPQPFRLELGAEVAESGGRRYARTGGQLVEVETELGDWLARDASEWRSLDWASLETYQIDRLQAKDAAGELVLERDGADWKRDGATIPYAAASDLLYAVADARAEAVTDPDAAGEPGVPRLELELSGDAGSERLLLYDAQANRHPARSADREALLLLDASTVDEIEQKLAAVRAAEPEVEEAALGDDG